jgi:Fe-S-cluster containining protein
MIKHVLRLITAGFRRKSPLLIGECNQCGDCCRQLTLSTADGLIRSEEAFRQLLAKRPEYRIFRIEHQDPLDKVIYFKCTRLGADNRCQAYEQRPRICRIYPNARMFDHGARLPSSCGYRLAPQSEFEAILQDARPQKQKSRRD